MPTCDQLQRIGRRFLGQDQPDRAAAYLRQAVIAHPEDAEHRFYYGQALGELGLYELAIDELKAGQNLAHGDPRFFGPLARMCSLCGWDQEALEAARRYAEIRPDDSAGWVDLAISLHGLGMYDDAETTYRRLLARDPADTFLLNNLACVLGEMGEVREARQLWGRCLQLQPNDEIARKNLKISYEDDDPYGGLLALTILLRRVRSRARRLRARRPTW